MTHPHDPPRQWSRPVEEVARAIAGADGEDYMEDWRRYDRRAEDAIYCLISLGFINENGIEAMKAEKEAKT